MHCIIAIDNVVKQDFIFCPKSFTESWYLWRMYYNWRVFVWPTQANLLHFREWEHPFPWLRWERLRLGNHCHHFWLFHMEGKHLYLHDLEKLWKMTKTTKGNMWPISSSSFTSPKKTEATRARALAFHAGQSEITIIIRPPTCGCIVLIAATCTMEGNWSGRFPPLPRGIPSPVS